jgi:hypothetical protein
MMSLLGDSKLELRLKLDRFCDKVGFCSIYRANMHAANVVLFAREPGPWGRMKYPDQFARTHVGSEQITVTLSRAARHSWIQVS